MQQVDIDKDDGGTRTLSIPPWQDRVLQKAVASLLNEAFDPLWKHQSYGYRKGRSRFNAKDAINDAIRQGYEWALESDVDSFFDSVCWTNLAARLHLLFPSDPLVPVIMNWVKAPIRTPDGDEIPRTQGLPQGSPLSPLLANLILDDFDGDMLALDYQLVRYADDFVLLFTSQQQAQQALPHVIASLNEHGLTLKARKTHIVEAKKGFRYLAFSLLTVTPLKPVPPTEKKHTC
ncbi:retron-type RNA-directed DNA polymerase [Photobacterium aphoticum]|uniref:RNA-directed DNA polymerase n=1 Tax=Photobacterium aphoticum TaxID=754436 RepID=A0A090QWI1_9GAMM|nr:retron-type RNA-directed DNA polymerase [Photobacterium aphoticum]